MRRSRRDHAAQQSATALKACAKACLQYRDDALLRQPSVYLSALHSAVPSLILPSMELRSDEVSCGFNGSIRPAAEAMASLHWSRSALIISSGSQAILGPAERNRIRAALSDGCLLISIIPLV